MLLEKNSQIPLYRQVKNYLKDKIVSGQWEQGYKIPTEKELAELFQVSTITVKRAVLDLVDNGYLYRKSGKGTFVSYQKNTDLSRLVTIKNKLGEKKEYPHKTIDFKKVKANGELRENLKLGDGEKVYHITRIKLEDGKNSIIENSFIPAGATPDLTQTDIENELLYNIFSNKYGLQLDKAKVFISTKAANEEEASLLNVSIGDPLLLLDRYTTVGTEYVVEYSQFTAEFKNAKYFLEIQL